MELATILSAMRKATGYSNKRLIKTIVYIVTGRA